MSIFIQNQNFTIKYNKNIQRFHYRIFLLITVKIQSINCTVQGQYCWYYNFYNVTLTHCQKVVILIYTENNKTGIEIVYSKK